MYTAVEKAIRNALLGSSTITAAVASRIYALQAPPGAAMPYVVFVHMAGGDENNTQLGSADLRYLIQAIGTDAQGVVDLATTIRTVFHKVNMTMDAPYRVFNSHELEPVRMVETVERVQYWHMGAIYRFRVSE